VVLALMDALNFRSLLVALALVPLVTGAQVAPSFPSNVLGERQVSWNYNGLRPIAAVPPVGVHPRIFVGPDERAEVCNRLTNTWAGQELLTNYIQRYTTLLRNPRSAYDSLPSSIKLMPDGTARLGNVGFYNDPYFYYTNLVAGQTNNIHTLISANNSTFTRTMAGEMALEALENWVFQNTATNQVRATNLAIAMDTWAAYLLSRSDFAAASNNWMLGSPAAFAEAYDFNHWAMTEPQRARVRTALARVIYAAPHQGVGVAPEADTSNWVSLDGFNLIAVMAMEGETSLTVEGFDTNYFNAYFTNAMGSFYKFLTYGWHPSGEPYEGMGKGWFGGARHIAFAKRGYNFFGHPHLQNFVKDIWPACLQPFGYSWNHYDLIGGAGADNVRGGRLYTASDQIAMQWVYTNMPAAAFLWRNFVMTDWCTNSPATGTNNYRTFLDFRDSKFIVSTIYGQDLLEAALFVQDPVTNVDWNVQNATALGKLDMVDTHGSTIVSRSDFSSNAVALQFHTRQDFGGHTYAERGGFSVSGLGRQWVWFPYALKYGQDPGFSSQILVDDVATFVTEQEGDKMRIPAKLAGWSTNSSALFATCDSTYSYTWQWKWNNYATNGTVTITSGFQAETNSFNSFRRSNNRIPESYGNAPFVSFPHWDDPTKREGIQRKSFNPMRQVIRTAGLVRGVRPYVLIADDIQKDASPHTYKWLLQIPKDLTLLTGGSLPTGFNAATDCLLQEPAATGPRALLVRILSPTNWTAFTETVSNVIQNSEQFYRVTVVTTNVAPAFKVMLYPFGPTDPIPTNNWTATNIFTVSLGGQTDTFEFAPRIVTTADGRAVTTSEFQITRGGTNIFDYRNQIEPFAYTMPPVAAFSATPTNGFAALPVNFTDNSTGFGITNRQWDFGNGVTLNTTNTSVSQTYMNPGSYTVRLIVRSPYGASTNTQPSLISASPVNPPLITASAVISTNLVCSGTNGAEGFNYLVLTTTNLSQPLDSWSVVATNVFGMGGGFQFTNALEAGTPQRFYRVRLP
jgi:PKD repeat protein